MLYILWIPYIIFTIRVQRQQFREENFKKNDTDYIAPSLQEIKTQTSQDFLINFLMHIRAEHLQKTNSGVSLSFPFFSDGFLVCKRPVKYSNNYSYIATRWFH